MKNDFDELISTLDMAEERSSEPEDSIEITQTEKQREQRQSKVGFLFFNRQVDV